MNHPLIENYIYEVSKRLSGKEKEDIINELRANIYDMLPEDPTEEEIIEVLNQLGDPEILASQYPQGQRYLISPAVYDEYITSIKWIVPIAAIAFGVIGIIVGLVGSFDGGFSVFRLFTYPIWSGIRLAFTMAFQALFWVTVVFICVERFGMTKEVKKGVRDLDKYGKNELKRGLHHIQNSDFKVDLDNFVKSKREWTTEDLPDEEPPKKSKYSIPLSDSIAELVIVVVFGSAFALFLLGLVPWPTFLIVDGVVFQGGIFTTEFIQVALPFTIITMILMIIDDVMRIKARKWILPVGIFTVFSSITTTILFIYAITSRTVVNPEVIEFMSARFDWFNNWNSTILGIQNLTITGSIVFITVLITVGVIIHAIIKTIGCYNESLER